MKKNFAGRQNCINFAVINNTLKLPSKTPEMEVKNAQAGTLESGDILVQISPSETSGLTVNLDSTVAYQFGRQIEKHIREELSERGIEKDVVDATDKGAHNCTIRARVTAAAVRATGNDVWQD